METDITVVLDAWQVVFLAADGDAIAEGGALGFASAAALDYDKDGRGVAALYSAMSEKVGDVGAVTRPGSSSARLTAHGPSAGGRGVRAGARPLA